MESGGGRFRVSGMLGRDSTFYKSTPTMENLGNILEAKNCLLR